MLGKSTRKRISSKKMLDQANPYQDLKRIREKSNLAIRDLTLVAKNLDEKQLQEIFTVEKIKPLLVELLKPKNKRVILIAEIMAAVVSDKLLLELPSTIVNTLKADIEKTWVYANMLAEYADKPMLKQKIKSKK